VSRKNRKRKHNPHNNATVLGASEVERRIYGKSLPDMHKEKRLAESRKELLTMPSLQDALQNAIQRNNSALHNIIDAWEADEPLPVQQPQPQEKQTMPSVTFPVTTNVSRATFDFVRDNPGLHHNEVKHKLIDKGFKDSSVTALISQLRRSGQIARLADGTYHATAKEYVPIKQVFKLAVNKKTAAKKAAKPVAKPAPKPVVKATEPKSEGIAALQPVATLVSAPAPVSAPMVVSNDVEYILSTLPIKQARSLYDELHKIFGAKA
jgi:preprotein translocase subunit SecD